MWNRLRMPERRMLVRRDNAQPDDVEIAPAKLCRLPLSPMPGRLYGSLKTSDEMRMKTPLVLSWSGGKDSAVALHELQTSGEYEIVALLTTVSEEYRRISHHGVREILLEQQAAAIGIPLEKVYLPAGRNQPCSNEVYERIMSDVM